MTQLFLISYAGTISSLALTHGADPKLALQVTAQTRACAPNPSWLTLDAGRRVLYCTEGGAAGTGALKAFAIADDGALTETSSVPVPQGAAHHALYNGGQALSTAFYYAGVVGIYDVSDPSHLRPLQQLELDFDVPGPGKEQDMARPHHIAFDPTGHYMLSVDLGDDRVRVYHINPTGHRVAELDSLLLPKGSFPRHCAFVSLPHAGLLKLYVLLQNLNAVLVYTAAYAAGGGRGFVFTKDADVPLTTDRFGRLVHHRDAKHLKASHLAISPDNRFLLASMRGDASFAISSPVESSVEIPSDSIVSFQIDQATGALTLADRAPSGGLCPRQFALSPAGDMIGVVSQTNGWVSIYERDNATGKLGGLIAFRDGFGNENNKGPVCLVWDATV